MEFLKLVFDNLRQGPVTEAFPFAPAEAPERMRGKVVIDPKLCVGCGTCEHVCVAGAIKITPHADGCGHDITVWRNTCCLCAQCRHYCPTHAISVINDWHLAHREEQKYTFIERAEIHYAKCAGCGAPLRVLPRPILEKIYAAHPEYIDTIAKLCPECRRKKTATDDVALAQARVAATQAPVVEAKPVEKPVAKPEATDSGEQQILPQQRGRGKKASGNGSGKKSGGSRKKN